MTSARIWSGKEAQETERPYTSWNDMILPTKYSWADLIVDNTEDDIPNSSDTSTRIWFGKMAQEIERPCNSWNDMILPKEYSWSDLDVDNTDDNFADCSEVESSGESYSKDSSSITSSPSTTNTPAGCARTEELNERLLESVFVPAHRRDCRIDPDDEWSSDDDSGGDADDEGEDGGWGSEYESDDEDFATFCERNFDD